MDKPPGAGRGMTMVDVGDGVRVKTAGEEWRAGWPLPFIGLLGNSASLIFAYSSGIFMLPVTTEFGWSRTQFSAGLSFAMVFSVFIMPVIGFLVDRWGSRRMALLGAPLFMLMLSSFSLTTGP